MIIPIIIGGSLAAVGIITLIIGCKKIKINTQIKLDNQRLEEDNINVKCQFCNNEYDFVKEDFEEFLNS